MMDIIATNASMIIFVIGFVLLIWLFCCALMNVNDMQQLGLLLILFGVFFGGWLAFITGAVFVAFHHTLNYLKGDQ